MFVLNIRKGRGVVEGPGMYDGQGCVFLSFSSSPSSLPLSECGGWFRYNGRGGENYSSTNAYVLFTFVTCANLHHHHHCQVILSEWGVDSDIMVEEGEKATLQRNGTTLPAPSWIWWWPWQCWYVFWPFVPKSRCQPLNCLCLQNVALAKAVP